ncbi:DUF262 domain-containing protein [Photobacterium profundum]|uniref:Uncharacterized protein n=1 Tax=Photobacterium profundum (strain SS9) TaxID=298386 RepID=Q6LTS9_PHOPR|nr:DUF262 domain-containing protein [Photobacterium profundum]CAG19296.1 hypothetical protein PBPRA0884 [Photobacterium profundum SS9]
MSQGEINELQVVSCDVDALFSNSAISTKNGILEGQLFIPEYQRPYTWGEKEVNRLVGDLIAYFSSEKPPEHQYYLGSVIIHQSIVDGVTRLNVIDGQQRLTTLAILAYVLGLPNQPRITYTSPSSQQQIAANVQWLKTWLADNREIEHCDLKALIKLEQINITLVITESEDDAYRFFETQNTGGVRLNGADIIKAHHLRAIEEKYQDSYAKQWESLGELTPLIDAIMKVRYWQAFRFKSLPTHRKPHLVKTEIVKELAESCLNQPVNVAYRTVQVTKPHTGVATNSLSGIQINNIDNGYAMRQPLNSGINTIDYLSYFAQLQHDLLLNERTLANLDAFYDFYFNDVIQKLDGTAYLKKLFDSTLLLYVSQFGLTQLHEAALWLFRMVYSPRVINQKTVKESSIQSFARDNKLFDFIVLSYTHEQLIGWLKEYSYTFEGSNLDDKKVKGRFIIRLENFFKPKTFTRETIQTSFDKQLCQAIQSKVNEAQT